MKERPILFSAPMVRAILEGTKTQTRRVVKLRPPNAIGTFFCGAGDWVWSFRKGADSSIFRCPYGVPGDRLWVRETWAQVWDCPALPCCEASESFHEDHRRVAYRSTEPNALKDYACSFDCDHDEPGCAPWKPSIHMPRRASRITLEVTGVRVERLQDITEADAKAEGVEPYTQPHGCIHPDQRVPGPGFDGARLGDQPHRLPFADLWESINGADSWAANPWVWVVEFKRLEAKSEAA